MLEPISEKDLAIHLDRSKVVEVEDEEGGETKKLSFKITPVPLILWDEDNSWYSRLRGSDPQKFAAALGRTVQAPTANIMRQVLVRGVLKPQISPVRGGAGIWVDDLLARNFLSLRLYSEIANLSCDGLLKVKEEVADGHAKPTALG